MKIKATQSFGDAVTTMTYQSGREYEVEDTYGEELVAAGLAEDISPPKPKQPEKKEADRPEKK